MLIQSINLASGDDAATGDSAAATADASTSPDELKGNIVLTVFQMAQPSGTSNSPAAPAVGRDPEPFRAAGLAAPFR